MQGKKVLQGFNSSLAGPTRRGSLQLWQFLVIP